MPGKTSKSATATRGKGRAAKKNAPEHVSSAVVATSPGPGAPTIFTQDIANELCALLSEGMSLRKACEKKEMPAIRTVYDWFTAHPEFLQQYTRAKQEAADSYADRVIDLANDVADKKLDPNAARVAMDGFKWAAGKIKPKVYGERLDITTDGEKLPAPMIYVPRELPYNAVKARNIIDAETESTPASGQGTQASESQRISSPAAENVVPGTAHSTDTGVQDQAAAQGPGSG